MTQERKAGNGMSAAVGAGIGVGIGLYCYFTLSIDWQGAMLLSVLGAGIAALIAMVLLQAMISLAKSGRAADAQANGTTRLNEQRWKKRKAIPWEVAATKP